jgi:cell division protein FtsB
MPSTLDPPDMPRLHALDEEFGEDPAAALHAGRRKTRLVMLAGLVLGLGAIGAIAFAWSNADGRLRFDLQSTITSPKAAQPPTADAELDRLRREIDALKDEVKDLTEAQRQAAHTIATVKAAEQDLRRNAPAPYWYSNLQALDLAMPKQPRWDTVAPLPRRPPAARSDSPLLAPR